MRIRYELSDKLIVKQAIPLTVAEGNCNIVIELSGLQGRAEIIAKHEDRCVKQVLAVEEGRVALPLSLCRRGKLSLDLVAYDENDNIARTWILEPIIITTLENKLKALTVIPDYEMLVAKLNELSATLASLKDENKELKQKVSELEEIIYTPGVAL